MHVPLTAVPQVHFTIPQDCGEHSAVCIVNLHNQSQNFPVDERLIGEYTAEVAQAKDDCKIATGKDNSLTTTIMITMTPQQLQGEHICLWRMHG